MVIKELKISAEGCTTLWKSKKKKKNQYWIEPFREANFIQIFNKTSLSNWEKTCYEGQLCVDFIFLAKNER